ncbi:MAG: hypothetical protein ACI8Q1_001975 [Parvicella sp.]|jgi:hypothetical protein
MIFGFNFPKGITNSVEPVGHIDNKKIGTRYTTLNKRQTTYED